MRIQVSGKGIEVGEALRARVAQGFTEATSKYAGRPTEATAVFSREGAFFVCEATVHLSTGLTVQARGRDDDAYVAFEGARERMAKQLRRHKRRLKDHHRDRQSPVASVPAAAYVLAPLADQAEGPEDAGDGAALGGAPEGSGDGPLDGPLDGAGPAIIAETATRIPALSVGEAVLQMELAHAPVLVFRNEARGTLNVVYRREDGTVGWIDPREPEGAEAAAPASRG